MFVHGEVCLASRTVSPFTLTGSCRDLTASAADIEPTLDRWREMPDTGSEQLQLSDSLISSAPRRLRNTDSFTNRTKKCNCHFTICSAVDLIGQICLN